MQKVNRQLFGRVVIFDPNGGSIIDLSSRYVIESGGPEIGEDYARLANGSKLPVRRESNVQIQITERESSSILDVLKRIPCGFKVLMLGVGNTENWCFLEPTRINVTKPSVSPGQQSNVTLEFDSNVFYPATWKGQSLINGIPWRGTNEIDGELVPKTSKREGYQGPRWDVPASTEVDLKGNADTISTGSPAKVSFEFPVWGSSLRVISKLRVDANIKVYDWFGDLIVSGNPVEIPRKSFEIEVVVKDAESTPQLKLVNLGTARGLVAGRIPTDCTKVPSPEWFLDINDIKGEIQGNSGSIGGSLLVEANFDEKEILTESGAIITTESGNDLTI